ncbi:type IX secretion system protein PorQ [Halocola ammonii]
MRTIFLSTVLALCSIVAQAQLGGQTIFQSLNVPSSARVAALGGNNIAVKDSDLNLAIYNPALLDSATSNQVALSYVNYFSDVNFGFASYAKNIDSALTMAATIQYANFGDFTETNFIGEETGSFTAGDYAFIVGAGYKIDTNFTIGANAKVIYSTLVDYSALGGAVDLAGVYHSKKRRFTAALVMKNIGYQFNNYTSDNVEEMPFEIQVGISKKLKHAPFRFTVIAENLQQWDLTYDNPNDQPEVDPVSGEVVEDNSFEFGDKLMRHIVLGAEVLITENINVRLGYNYRRRQELKINDRPGTAGLSWGVGFKISRFEISYGRASYHLAGPSNHFTLTTNLSSW